MITSFFITSFAYSHPLGMPNKIFDKSFAKHIHYMMRYSDLIKLTDGEGMPGREGWKHWDGNKNTYLSIELYKNVIKSAQVTLSDGSTIYIDSETKF